MSQGELKRVITVSYADDSDEETVAKETARGIKSLLMGLPEHVQAVILGNVLATSPDRVRSIAVVIAEHANPLAPVVDPSGN